MFTWSVSAYSHCNWYSLSGMSELSRFFWELEGPERCSDAMDRWSGKKLSFAK